VCPNPKKP
jgi:hypothetical protein